jgi:hypothetical protein
MAEPAVKRMSLEEFLRWDEGTDTRYELIGGLSGGNGAASRSAFNACGAPGYQGSMPCCRLAARVGR